MCNFGITSRDSWRSAPAVMESRARVAGGRSLAGCWRWVCWVILSSNSHSNSSATHEKMASLDHRRDLRGLRARRAAIQIGKGFLLDAIRAHPGDVERALSAARFARAQLVAATPGKGHCHYLDSAERSGQTARDARDGMARRSHVQTRSRRGTPEFPHR